jgi:gentisate 1,2-dioxygenase
MASQKNKSLSLENYKVELEKNSVNLAAIYDEPLIIPKKKRVKAFHWKWTKIERLLFQSLEFQNKLPAGQAGAERRIIRLQNPGLDCETVTETMSMSVQLLMPGEFARPHRHTPVAPGDLILTPYMQWHEHGNDGSEPGIWIDGLDFPMVRYFDAVIKEDIEVPQEYKKRTGTSVRRFSSPGLRPSWIPQSELQRESLVHFRWENTEKTLFALADGGDFSPTEDIILEYFNPTNGDSVFYTIGCYIQMIRPEIKTKEHKENVHKIYHVFRGKGETIIDGQKFKWSDGDFFVVPSGSWHYHENTSKNPAILFSLQDKPALKRLGLYREEIKKTV